MRTRRRARRANVGVALEALDVLASSVDVSTMRAAVIFMFVSGEEEGFLGAHGVCHSHPWRHHIQAVVNLESMGSGGPSLLFRASADTLGQWMLRLWAKKAPHAAGSVVAQDVFRSGLINSDTDFRCVDPVRRRVSHRRTLLGCGAQPGTSPAASLCGSPHLLLRGQAPTRTRRASHPLCPRALSPSQAPSK